MDQARRIAPQKSARRAASALIAAALAASLSACAADTIAALDPFGAPDLPESPDVETAAWPRLVDGPSPVEVTGGPESVAAQQEKGRRLQAGLDEDFTELTEARDAMTASPEVSDPALEAEIAALRAEAAAIAAEE